MTTPAAWVPALRLVPSSLHGDVDQLADVRVAFVFLAQVGALLERFIQGDVEHLAAPWR